MRTIQNSDIFAFGRILSKANLKEEIKKISVNNEKDLEAIGYELIYTVFISCSDSQVEEEIYSFLGSLFEMSADDVRKLDPIETMEKIKGVADWEKWKSFFSLGVKSMK